VYIYIFICRTFYVIEHHRKKVGFTLPFGQKIKHYFKDYLGFKVIYYNIFMGYFFNNYIYFVHEACIVANMEEKVVCLINY